MTLPVWLVWVMATPWALGALWLLAGVAFLLWDELTVPRGALTWLYPCWLLAAWVTTKRLIQGGTLLRGYEVVRAGAWAQWRQSYRNYHVAAKAHFAGRLFVRGDGEAYHLHYEHPALIEPRGAA